MKKNKLLVILSFTLTLSCLLSALSMNAFAGALQNDHYVTTPEYTSLTNTYGYSSVSYTGNFYGEDDPNNNAILASEVGGGRISEFVTTLEAHLWGGGSINTNSNQTGTRTLSATFTSTIIDEGKSGYSHQTCYKIGNSINDRWERYYFCTWLGEFEGWGDLTSESSP